jgi:hypothetical protein
MLEVEIDDFGQRVHLSGLEVTDEFCQTFFEFRVYVMRLVDAVCIVNIKLTNNLLKAILPIHGKAGLTR